MRRFLFGVAFGVFLAILVPLLVIASGVINFAATTVPSSIEVATAKFAVGQSMSWRVPNVENPYQSDNLAAKSGFHHYADTCLTCHGAPGVAPKEFAKGLNPPAPNLIDSLDRYTDSELFWITKNGIRMTGMPALGPTHTDQDIWNIVTFVRHLPNLTDTEKTKLKTSRGNRHQHGESDSAEESGSNPIVNGPHAHGGRHSH